MRDEGDDQVNDDGSELPEDFWAEVDERKAEADRLEEERLQKLENLRRFEELYRREIAQRQAKLESLRAELAAVRNQRDAEAERRAAEAAEVAQTLSPKERHRTLVKKIHPDRAVDEKDRAVREDLMKRVNAAMSANDLEELSWLEAEVDLYTRSQILSSERESVRSRMLHSINERIEKLTDQILGIETQSLWDLFMASEVAREEGTDLLGGMAKDMDEQIAMLSSELENARQA